MPVLEPDPDFFERLPTDPGVYLMKDAAGQVLYVGKAKNLRARVRQYFRPGADSRFFVTAGLLGRVLADVDTVVVDNEKEALLLENHLIKQYQPRFNINLRDDKQYLVLRVDPRADYPRVEVVRNIKGDSARYFGPYHSATSCRETLRVLNRHFQLRTCTDHVLKTRTRPCLQYQIKRCPAPCVYPVDKGAYAEQVEDVMMFLEGKNDQLVTRMSERMHAQAQAEEFESAARLRDSMGAIDKSLARQRVVQEQLVDQDVFGMWREGDAVEVVVMYIRSGKLVGRRAFRERDQELANAEVLESFVQQYYATGTLIPEEVIVGEELEGAAVLMEWLSNLRGARVRLVHARRGSKARLLALANKNAASSAVSRKGRDDDTLAGLVKLKGRLSLKQVPRHIECFDIAHIQGAATVASRVVFVDGKPERALYRTFKIKSAANDDFAAMYEALSRRFKRALEPEQELIGWKLPDLLVVDGGKGQLNQALAALADLGIEITADKGFDVIGLAKEREDTAGVTQPDRVFLRNTKEPLRLRPNTTEMYILSQIRDEAHRFANTFHRQQRKRTMLRSTLDDIPGIGAKRRKQLLRQLGSLKAVKQASVDELAAVEGMSRKAAEAVYLYFHGLVDTGGDGPA